MTRSEQLGEDEALTSSELCIRVMEAFFAKLDNDDRFNQLYMVLYAIYGDVLREELAPFAFELALEAFARERIILDRRRERDARLPTIKQTGPKQARQK